ATARTVTRARRAPRTEPARPPAHRAPAPLPARPGGPDRPPGRARTRTPGPRTLAAMAGGGREGSPGRIVDDRFELVERLGRGGMGTVWRARDLVLERDVALKEVRAPAAGPGGPAEAVRERVLVEARALARISHPHVVTVHHVVAAEPFPWIV